MAQREITQAEIDHALARAETRYQPKSHPDRTVILSRTIFGGRLKVVVRTRNPEYLITVAECPDE
jgi:hypothetical protein